MKIPRVRLCLHALALAVVTLTQSNAASLPFVSTFANDSLGALPAGWSPNLSTSPAVTAAKAAQGDSQSVLFSANDQGMQLPLTPTNALQWDFWVYPTGTIRSATFGTLDSSSRWGIWASFGSSTNGLVSYYANNAWTVIPNSSFVANQWYKVRIVARLTPLPTFDFYMSAAGSGDLPASPQGRNLPLRNPATTDFSTLRIEGNGLRSAFYFDDSAVQIPTADGFEADAVGVGVPAGWTNMGSTSPEILSTGADGSTRSLKLAQTTNSLMLPFAAADAVTLDFKFNPASLGRTLTWGLLDQDSHWGPYLAFGVSSGALSYYANNAWAAVPGVALSATNAWYRVRLVARTLPTPSFDVYVSAADSDTLPVTPQGANLPLRDTQASDFASLSINSAYLSGASTLDGIEIVKDMAPSTPVLNTPLADATTYMPTSSFDWIGSSTVDKYEIQIASDPSFTNLIDTDSIGIERYVADQALPVGTCYWRVRSRAANGLASAYTPGRAFSIQTPTRVYNISGTASAASIQNIIGNAVTPAVINFAAGANYVLDPGTASHLIKLTSKSDLIINGNGANITFTQPMCGLAKLTACNRILMRDLTVDYQTVPYSVGTILSTGTGGTFTMSLDPGMPPFNAPHMLANWTWGLLLDGTIPGKIKDDSPSSISTTSGFVTVTSGSLYTLQLTATSNLPQFTPGSKYIQFARNNGGKALVDCSGTCNDITSLNITNYGISSMHYMNVRGGNFKVLHCRSLIKDGRWFGGNADGLHIESNLPGPWMEGCEFEGVGDDSVALYNKAIFINQKVNDTTLRLGTGYFNLDVGDTFTIFNPKNGTAMAENLTVSAVTAVGSPATAYDVVFSPAFSGSITITGSDGTQNPQVFGTTKVNNGFVIRGNTFSCVRRYGAILRGSQGVVENNSYNYVAACPIFLRNEPDSWYNGLNCSSISIANNMIQNCGFTTNSYSLGQIVVALYKNGGSPGLWKAHQDISIKNNVIFNWQEWGIQLQNAKNCEVVGNTITADPGVAFDNTRTHYAIYVNNVQDSQITSNLITDPRPLTSPTTQVVNCTNVIVTP